MKQSNRPDNSAIHETNGSWTAHDIAALIDHTLLKAEASRDNIETLCQEAMRYGFHSVCVSPWHVSLAFQRLKDSPVKVCSVAGFPLGTETTRIKAMEAAQALEDGATEIDMVLNIGALKGGEDDIVHSDIRAVVDACGERGAICKVILETCLLTEDEKIRASKVAIDAGAEFLKTSTGLSTGGATVEDVMLMTDIASPANRQVKAAGGIRTLEDVLNMVRAGASRIGTSNGVGIMEEADAQYGQANR